MVLVDSGDTRHLGISLSRRGLKRPLGKKRSLSGSQRSHFLTGEHPNVCIEMWKVGSGTVLRSSDCPPVLLYSFRHSSLATTSHMMRPHESQWEHLNKSLGSKGTGLHLIRSSISVLASTDSSGLFKRPDGIQLQGSSSESILSFHWPDQPFSRGEGTLTKWYTIVQSCSLPTDAGGGKNSSKVEISTHPQEKWSGNDA